MEVKKYLIASIILLAIKVLFGLDDKQISKIDFSEVNYLYENITI